MPNGICSYYHNAFLQLILLQLTAGCRKSCIQLCQCSRNYFLSFTTVMSVIEPQSVMLAWHIKIHQLKNLCSYGWNCRNVAMQSKSNYEPWCGISFVFALWEVTSHFVCLHTSGSRDPHDRWAPIWLHYTVCSAMCCHPQPTPFLGLLMRPTEVFTPVLNKLRGTCVAQYRTWPCVEQNKLKALPEFKQAFQITRVLHHSLTSHCTSGSAFCKVALAIVMLITGDGI